MGTKLMPKIVAMDFIFTSITMMEQKTATTGIATIAIRFSFLGSRSNIGQYFTLVGEILVDKKSRPLKWTALFLSQEGSL